MDTGAKAEVNTEHTDEVGSLPALSLYCAYYGPTVRVTKCDQRLRALGQDAYHAQ